MTPCCHASDLFYLLHVVSRSRLSVSNITTMEQSSVLNTTFCGNISLTYKDGFSIFSSNESKFLAIRFNAMISFGVLKNIFIDATKITQHSTNIQ
jgi:hypothetical protein